MNTAGNLRHGKAHRKQADHLRQALAKAQVWSISVSEHAFRSWQELGVVFPFGANVQETMDLDYRRLSILVTTRPGHPMRLAQQLPLGVTAVKVR